MKMIVKNVVICTLATVMLAACSGKPSPRVNGLSTDDKNLNCEQLRLEMNDASFIRAQAAKNQRFHAGDVFTPGSYMATKSNADDAVGAADERLRYLQNVYEIKKCGRPMT